MKKITALTLGSMIMMNSVAFAFSDLTEDHWAYRNVINMQEKGIISGFEDNTFRPNDALTRVQFITMGVKGLGIEEQISEMKFDDIASHWGTQYINLAGSAMCDNEGNFNPDNEALREDVAMAIVKFNKLEDSDYSLETLNTFNDAEAISENRKKYVAIAVENGYMSGNADGSFYPKKALTRAEGATVIFNILNKEENEQKNNVANWDGEYISNIDGLVTIKLTKLSDTEVNFYIKGNKNGRLFAANENAVINGDVAKYQHGIIEPNGEFVFRFENSDLIIEINDNEEFDIFAGRYKVDDKTVNTIVRTVERNPLEGEYLLGEEVETGEISSFEGLEHFLQNTPLSVGLEISNIADTSAIFTIGGFVNGDMVAIMGDLEFVDGKWKYFDTFDEEYVLEIEFKEDSATVTGLNESKENLNGIYSKKLYNPEEEYEKYKEQLDGTELSGGFMY